MDWLMTPGVTLVQTSVGADVWSGWGSVIMGVSFTLVALGLAGIVIWQLFKTKQTRMITQATVAQDEAFRRLAERTAESQATIAIETARISAELKEMSGRIAAMERMLREVG